MTLMNINPQREIFHHYDFPVYTTSKYRDPKLDTYRRISQILESYGRHHFYETLFRVYRCRRSVIAHMPVFFFFFFFFCLFVCFFFFSHRHQYWQDTIESHHTTKFRPLSQIQVLARPRRASLGILGAISSNTKYSMRW